jgi:hypothetical protein
MRRGLSGSSPGAGLFGGLMDVFQPTGRYLLEEQERQHSLVDDVGTGAPPLGVDLEAGTVRLVRRRPKPEPTDATDPTETGPPGVGRAEVTGRS